MCKDSFSWGGISFIPYTFLNRQMGMTYLIRISFPDLAFCLKKNDLGEKHAMSLQSSCWNLRLQRGIVKTASGSSVYRALTHRQRSDWHLPNTAHCERKGNQSLCRMERIELMEPFSITAARFTKQWIRHSQSSALGQSSSISLSHVYS